MDPKMRFWMNNKNVLNDFGNLNKNDHLLVSLNTQLKLHADSIAVRQSKTDMICEPSRALPRLSKKYERLEGSDRLSLTWGFRDNRFMYEIAKRIIDVLFASVALIIALPVMIVIGIMIKLDSQGPALFTQIRVGRDNRRTGRRNGHLYERRKFDLGGKPFTMYKFRTMRVDVEAYTFMPKQSNDFRLTKVGRVIRKLCLDELPQLWNVLWGDMSLVGPRPEMPHIVQSYNSRERSRLSVKPGLTGLWQLHGSRYQMIHENLHYDLEYLHRRSLYFDFKILFRTIPFVLGLNNV
jgi:lipopolysaccharide/colanic/teichoic acid biosynthesis glycosyltransferase